MLSPVPNVLLCHISCPACKADTNAFVCSLQHVEGTGREDSLNTLSYIPVKTRQKTLVFFIINFSILAGWQKKISCFIKVISPCILYTCV